MPQGQAAPWPKAWAVLGVPASCHQEDVLDIDGPPSSKKKDK